MDIRIIALCTVVALGSTACYPFGGKKPSARAPQAREKSPGAPFPSSDEIVRLDSGKIISIHQFLGSKKSVCEKGSVKKTLVTGAFETEQFVYSKQIQLKGKDGKRLIGKDGKPITFSKVVTAEVNQALPSARMCKNFPCDAIGFDFLNKMAGENKLSTLSAVELTKLEDSVLLLIGYLTAVYDHNYRSCILVNKITKEDTPVTLEALEAFLANIQFAKKNLR